MGGGGGEERKQWRVSDVLPSAHRRWLADGWCSRYVIPWGRISDVRADVQKEVDAGKNGEGKAVKLWEWCERETKAYL